MQKNLELLALAKLLQWHMRWQWIPQMRSYLWWHLLSHFFCWPNFVAGIVCHHPRHCRAFSTKPRLIISWLFTTTASTQTSLHKWLAAAQRHYQIKIVHTFIAHTFVCQFSITGIKTVQTAPSIVHVPTCTLVATDSRYSELITTKKYVVEVAYVDLLDYHAAHWVQQYQRTLVLIIGTYLWSSCKMSTAYRWAFFHPSSILQEEPVYLS